MNRKAIALLVGGLLVLAAIIYFIFFYEFGQPEQDPSSQTNTQVEAEPVISTTAPDAGPAVAVRTEAEKSRDAANQLAIFFTERYGTSSTQADFSNLVDSELFMTDAFKAVTEKYIAAERTKALAQAYSGITTKAIIAEFKTISEIAGTAEVTVRTKRQEVNDKKEANAYSQDLNLTLKKVGGDWKVDSAVWIKR